MSALGSLLVAQCTFHPSRCHHICERRHHALVRHRLDMPDQGISGRWPRAPYLCATSTLEHAVNPRTAIPAIIGIDTGAPQVMVVMYFHNRPGDEL